MTLGLFTLSFLIGTFSGSVLGLCEFNPINATSHLRVEQTTTNTKTESSPCIWLITGQNLTTRIEVTVNNFGSMKKDYLLIGNGHNSSDDDSIFIKLKGRGHSFMMVSSGHRIWIEYRITGNRTYNAGFNIHLDMYREQDSAVECLQQCQCLIIDSELYIQCLLGWTLDTVNQLPDYTSHLTLSGGNMTFLEKRSFSRLPELRSLALLENKIKIMKNDTFDGLNNMNLLNLSSNCIHEMELGAFNGLPNLYQLDIRVNKLIDIQPDRFKILPALHKLYLHNNQIDELPSGLCKYFQLNNTLSMRLDGNLLTRIPPGIFDECLMIITLKLSRNRITHLQNGSFRGLTTMVSLELSRNKIETIDPGAFADLSHLLILRLKENNIVAFRSYAFIGLSTLSMLDLRYNSWMSIEPYAFWGMHNLTFLFLERLDSDQNQGKLTLKSLEGLDSLHDMFVDDYRLCCLKPAACSPQTPPPLFHTCERLMPNGALQTLLWIFGISAMAGNLYVFTLRWQEKNVRNPTQSILISNLAISDFIMGFYMLIIAGADVHFGKEFFLEAEVWKSSGVCIFAGFLSLFSSEASVFFVVLISVDRLLCVALPFGKKRMTAYLAKVSCLLVWAAVTIIGLVAIILQVANTDAYDLATVCVGIPLVSTKKTQTKEVKTDVDDTGASLVKLVTETTDTASTWQFAIAIYLGLNFLAFVVVLVCYIAIGAIVATKLPSKQLQRKIDRSREMKMAGKMALIVFTDFCCWMPVIMLGILIQSGAVEAVPIETYAWLVALVLPLNSALNPYIYTISTEITKYKRRRQEKKETYTMRKLASPSQTINTCTQTRTSRFSNFLD
ncbi:uncharacterized protein [Amphiura filiformis]|uniref:uncharacterized protein n=1 Tax=Amphiura filiformis TaxID=82378 RepID=UPI003B226D0B